MKIFFRSNNGFLASKSDLPKEQEFSIKSELRRLKEIALKPEMDEKSVLLLNYGLPFIDRMSFSSYRKMVDRAARTLDGYKGQVVVRTTSSLQKPTKDLLKTFETFQVSRNYGTKSQRNSTMIKVKMRIIDRNGSK